MSIPTSIGCRVVQVPRALTVKWAGQPWNEAVAAAERGDDGMLMDVAAPINQIRASRKRDAW